MTLSPVSTHSSAPMPGSSHLNPKRTRWGRTMITVLSTIIPPGVNWIRQSWQVRQEIHPETRALLSANQPVIYAFWHGRMYSLLRAFPKADTIAILISPSNDGEMIQRTIAKLGFERFIRGSHKRGGSQALRAMLRALKKENTSVCFMVDGPRGPRYEVKPGVIRLASQANCPIVPVASSAKTLMFKATRSWDHFQAPLPYTPMTIALGAPLWVPPKLNETALPEWQTMLQAQLLRETRQLDVQYGHLPDSVD